MGRAAETQLTTITNVLTGTVAEDGNNESPQGNVTVTEQLPAETTTVGGGDESPSPTGTEIGDENANATDSPNTGNETNTNTGVGMDPSPTRDEEGGSPNDETAVGTATDTEQVSPEGDQTAATTPTTAGTATGTDAADGTAAGSAINETNVTANATGGAALVATPSYFMGAIFAGAIALLI